MPKNQLDPASDDQRRAWGFYGIPRARGKRGQSAAVTVGGSSGQQVGEVRYIIGWVADQMVRMGWRVTIQGSEDWVLKVPDGETVISDSKVSDVHNEQHPTNASQRLLEVIMWNTRTVREVTTNLFVAGELHYALDGKVWRVVSVIRDDRTEIVNRSSIVVHGLWPHPADPGAPDAPLFGVLGVLDDMMWLNRLSRSQSANRVGMRGIIGVADSLKTSTGETGEAFWKEFEESISRSMEDPEDVSPVGIIGPADLVEPSSGGHGMKGLSWTIPNFPYDDKVDERMEKLVQRLAYGLPVPPEVLLGLQAQSKATAFQVEGSTYRAHIEPVALLVADVATDALTKFLPEEVGRAEVVPDPTAILARRHSVSDVLEAFDRGAANYAYLREVLGIPERAELTDEDLALRREVLGNVSTVQGISDPADDAASEPVSAAATLPAGQTPEVQADTTPDDEHLADLLHRIDMAALHELIGASAQAVTKARERVGAHLRSSPKLKDRIPKDVPNEEVLTKLDSKLCMDSLGAKGEELVNTSLATTLTWWGKRISKAREQAAEVLGSANIDADFSEQSAIDSVAALHAALSHSVMTGATVQDGDLRTVLNIAGG